MTIDNLMDDFIIKISGREFSSNYVIIQPIRISQGIKNIAEVSIDIIKYPKFLNVYFKDIIEIYNLYNRLLYKGYVKSYIFTDKKGYIVAQDYSLKLEVEGISALESSPNLPPAYIVAILAKSVGIKEFVTPARYDTNEREFIIILPIQNLEITQQFKIGNVEFYYTFDTSDDINISNTDNGKTQPVWLKSTTRAKLIIRAKDFYDAIITGYSVISKSIDVIALRTDLSFPSVKIFEEQVKLEFDYFIYQSRVKIPAIVYCREANTNAYVIYGIENIRDNVLSDRKSVV